MLFRRMQVLREIPRLIKSPCTILQMKSELFADFSRVVRQPVFLRNVILSNRDYHRYTEDSLTPSKLALDPIETHSAFLHDAFHYFSPADVLALFRHSPKLGVLIGTAIIPFESVYQDFSAQPELYRFAVKGDQLLYTPEGDNYNCYSQPLEARKWLLTSRLVDSSTGEVFTVEVVDQRGPFVSISVTRSLLLSPPMRSFVNEGMIVLPQVFRRKLYAQRFVPVKLFRSLYFYGRNITTMKPKDLYAKLRQHSGFLTSETLPSDLAEYLIMVVIALLEHEVGFSGLERLYYSGFSGLIRHYTIGWLKSHTVDRFRRMVISNYLSLIHEESVLVLPTAIVHVAASHSTYMLTGCDTHKADVVVHYLAKLFNYVPQMIGKAKSAVLGPLPRELQFECGNGPRLPFSSRQAELAFHSSVLALYPPAPVTIVVPPPAPVPCRPLPPRPPSVSDSLLSVSSFCSSAAADPPTPLLPNESVEQLAPDLVLPVVVEPPAVAAVPAAVPAPIAVAPPPAPPLQVPPTAPVGQTASALGLTPLEIVRGWQALFNRTEGIQVADPRDHCDRRHCVEHAVGDDLPGFVCAGGFFNHQPVCHSCDLIASGGASSSARVYTEQAPKFVYDHFGTRVDYPDAGLYVVYRRKSC